MTDTTENHFARDLGEQTEQDDPVMVMMRADDARGVLALLGEVISELNYEHGEGFDCRICRKSLDDGHTSDCLIIRIERVLATHDPREKAVSDD